MKGVVFNHRFSFLALIRLLRLKAARSRIDDGFPGLEKREDPGHQPNAMQWAESLRTSKVQPGRGPEGRLYPNKPTAVLQKQNNE